MSKTAEKPKIEAGKSAPPKVNAGLAAIQAKRAAAKAATAAPAPEPVAVAAPVKRGPGRPPGTPSKSRAALPDNLTTADRMVIARLATLDGRMFAAARALCGLDRQSFAAQAGISGATVGNIEAKTAPVAKDVGLWACRQVWRAHGVAILSATSLGYDPKQATPIQAEPETDPDLDF